MPRTSFIPELSSLCSLGPRQQQITGFFVELFRLHFSNPDSVESEIFKQYPWTNDPLTSGILIEEHSRWHPEAAGQRPSLVIRRGKWQVVNRAVNNQSDVTFQGHVEHTVPVIGTHTFFIVCREGPETELLATEVWDYLVSFGSILRKTLHLSRFQTMDLEPLGELVEATDRHTVPITVAYSFMKTWVLKEHGPLLKLLQFGAEREAG